MAEYTGCAAGDNYCVDCDRNYCNAAPIPWFRVKCHQCQGAECSVPTLNTAQYCANYVDNDQCYSIMSIGDGEPEIYRGCMSDAATSPGKQLCESEGENCTKCTGTECNNNVLKINGKCYFCDGTEDTNCASLTGISSIPCPDGDQDGCFHSQVGKLLRLGWFV